MYNRFSSNSLTKHGVDHSIKISNDRMSNALPLFQIVRMSEADFVDKNKDKQNKKNNVLQSTTLPVIIK